MHKICTFLLVLFCGFSVHSQVEQVAQDTVKTGFSLGKIQLKNPPSIRSAYTYDPVTDRYVYTSTLTVYL